MEQLQALFPTGFSHDFSLVEWDEAGPKRGVHIKTASVKTHHLKGRNCRRSPWIDCAAGPGLSNL